MADQEPPSKNGIKDFFAGRDSDKPEEQIIESEEQQQDNNQQQQPQQQQHDRIQEARDRMREERERLNETTKEPKVPGEKAAEKAAQEERSFGQRVFDRIGLGRKPVETVAKEGAKTTAKAAAGEGAADVAGVAGAEAAGVAGAEAAGVAGAAAIGSAEAAAIGAGAGAVTAGVAGGSVAAGAGAGAVGALGAGALGATGAGGAAAGGVVAAATSEIWGPILITIVIVLAIAVVLIVIFIALGQSGKLGSTPFKSAAAYASETLLANSGDSIARRALDAKDIPTFTAQMEKIRIAANAKKPADTDAIKLVDEVEGKLKTYGSTLGKVDDQTLNDAKNILNQLQAKGYDGVSASELGQKIAADAISYTTPDGQQKYQSCSVGDKSACNEFAIKVMHETGADPKFSGLAYDQYLYTKGKTACYDAFVVTSASQLAVGDLLFRSSQDANGHGHVAFYVGGGQIASASLGGHIPKIGRWYPGLNAAARLKNGPCTS